LARKRFVECELLFRNDAEGFIPSIEEIEKDKHDCTKELRYAEYLEDGKRAFNIRDYKTAIALFQGALKIKPGSHDVMRLQEGAERLMNATVKVDVPNKGGGGTPTSNKPNPTKQITIKRRSQSPNRPLSIKIRQKGDKPQAPSPTASKKPVVVIPERTATTEKKLGRDLTYLWVALLVVAYFLLLKLLGIFG